MAKKSSKKGSVNFGRIETVILIALSVVLVFWAGLLCNKKQPDLLRPKPKEVPKTKIETQVETPSSTVQTIAPKPIASSSNSSSNSSTNLFVMIDSLKVRSAPHLDSTLVSRIREGEVVYYLHERSSFKQKIYMNGEFHNVPWVKIRTKKGQVGWVYSAGVQFYK